MAKGLKKVETDSYASLRPDNLKHLHKQLPSLDDEYGSFPVNAIFHIRVDDRKEHEILGKAIDHATQNALPKREITFFTSVIENVLTS